MGWFVDGLAWFRLCLTVLACDLIDLLVCIGFLVYLVVLFCFWWVGLRLVLCFGCSLVLFSLLACCFDFDFVILFKFVFSRLGWVF